MTVTRTERGWAGHFIAARNCMFRRNTLVDNGKIKVVVSTVGGWNYDNHIEQLGAGRYYETMAFYANESDTRYYDADVSCEYQFESNWRIDIMDGDDLANDMHEAVVQEIMEKLDNRKHFDSLTGKFEYESDTDIELD